MAATTTNLHGAKGLPVISVSTDGGSSYTAVAELIDPSFPATSVESGDTTNTDITNGYKTKIAGWSELQSHSLVSLWREDTWVQVQALIGLDIDFKITYTDAGHSTTDSAITYSGHVDNIEIVSPNEDVWTVSWSITPSGKDTFTVGT